MITPRTQSIEMARFNSQLADDSADAVVDFLVHQNDNEERAYVLARQAMQDARWALRITEDETTA